VKAVDLSNLDFNDPSLRDLPFFSKARDHYTYQILQHRPLGFRQGPGPSERPLHTASPQALPATAQEDVNIGTGRDVQYPYPEGDSDRGVLSQAISEFGNGNGTRHQQYDEPKSRENAAAAASEAGSTPPPQLTAALALNLQPPALSGFRVTDTAADGSAPRGLRATVEPPQSPGFGSTFPDATSPCSGVTPAAAATSIPAVKLIYRLGRHCPHGRLRASQHRYGCRRWGVGWRGRCRGPAAPTPSTTARADMPCPTPRRLRIGPQLWSQLRRQQCSYLTRSSLST
jgi:hypothetical protein